MNKSFQKLNNTLKLMYNGLTSELKNKVGLLMSGDFDSAKKDLFQGETTMVFVGKLGTWLTMSKELQESHKIVFSEFEPLCEMLKQKEFSPRDVHTILTYIFERNIHSAKLLDEEYMVEAPSETFPEGFIEEMFSPDCILNCGRTDSYYESFIELETMKMQKEQTNPKTKQGMLDKKLSRLDFLAVGHDIINTFYLDKKDTYTKEDIDFIDSGLKSLNISDEVRKKFCDYLIIKLEKRLSQPAPIESKVIVPRVVEEVKPINHRQIKKTFKELETYFDFFNMLPIRTLNYDEIIFCLAKIKQTDCSIGLMEEFISKIDRYNEHEDKTLYASVILRRLIAHKETLLEENQDITEIEHTISVIEGYLKEISLTELEDEKEVWQEFIKEELPHAKTLLPKKTI